MMQLTVFAIVWICHSASAQTGDRHMLPDSFGPSRELREVAGEEFGVRAWISNDGEIVVEVVLAKIKTRESAKFGLKGKTGINDWSTRFVLVPRLSENELKDVEEVIASLGHEERKKGAHSFIDDLEQHLPDVIGETYAYRVLPSMHVPSERVDIAKVEEFIERLIAKYRLCSRRHNSKSALHTLLLL